MSIRPRRLPTVAATCLLWSTTAAAQSSDQEAVAAAQFDRGLAAMNEGNLDVACPALTESVRLDPRAGAIFTLAACEARWGHVASADAHYDDYLARYSRMTTEMQRQQRGREKIAEQKRAELRPRIPQLQIRLAGTPSGAVVKRDGIILGAPSLGVFLPLDPGVHVLVVEMPDGGRSERTVTLVPGARQEIVLDVPAAAQRALSRPPTQDAAAPVATSRTPWLGYTALGIGAVGVGVGVVGGLGALSSKSTVDQHCQGAICDHQGKAAADSAKSSALVSTLGFAVGGVALATGIVLLLTHARDRSTVQRTLPMIAADARGATLGATGTF